MTNTETDKPKEAARRVSLARSFCRFVKRALLFKSTETIFRTIAFLVLIGGIYVFRSIQGTRAWLREHRNFETPPWSNYLLSLASMVVIFGFRFLMRFLLKNKMLELMVDKYEGQGKLKNANRMVKWVCDILYYSVTSLTLYYLLKDSPILPSYYLGSGDCAYAFKGYPYLPEIPYVDVFFRIQLGNHLFALCDQIMFKRKDMKFWEMLLHHILACMLMVGSYSTGNLLCGSLVLIAHDPGDVFLCLLRLYGEIKNKRFSLAVVFLIICIAVWSYSRLYFFPLCVLGDGLNHEYHLLGEEFWSHFIVVFWFNFGMLCMLVVMHAYWLTFLLKVGASGFSKKGKIVNLYDKTSMDMKNGVIDGAAPGKRAGTDTSETTPSDVRKKNEQIILPYISAFVIGNSIVCC
eukprot:TRINITY_DN2541_c0_g1_i1.p1 TRINITY_DN2541_c0_g1~~TRINITY_DN2541_c0_g1_i1.p1  ORF type:complete len:405 (+),score=115.73 TRINITY_DN2541_c0_g1_i1:248-1462(+)